VSQSSKLGWPDGLYQGRRQTTLPTARISIKFVKQNFVARLSHQRMAMTRSPNKRQRCDTSASLGKEFIMSSHLDTNSAAVATKSRAAIAREYILAQTAENYLPGTEPLLLLEENRRFALMTPHNTSDPRCDSHTLLLHLACSELKEMLTKTIKWKENKAALIIGGRGCGKTLVSDAPPTHSSLSHSVHPLCSLCSVCWPISIS